MAGSPEELAKMFFEKNYSCSESVWLALGQDLTAQELAFGLKLSSGFSGGAACGSICGAVAGAILAIGRWYGRELGGPRSDDAKAITKALVDAFVKEYGSLDCCDIKPTTTEWREKCTEYVMFVAKITDELLDKGAPDDDCG